MRLLLLPVLGAALVAQPARRSPGPQPDVAPEAWCVVDYAADAGVHNGYVLDLAAGAGGEVFVASSEGLRCFDGWAWNCFGVEHGLPSHLVRSVCMTRDGVLWVGTDRGAGIWTAGKFDASATAGHLAGPSVRRIVEDVDGALWFCCDQWPRSDVSAGLTVCRAGQWHSYGVGDGLPSDYVSDFVVTPSGRRFALTAKGVAELVDGRFQRPWPGVALRGAETYAWSLAEQANGSLLVGCEGWILQRLGDQWTERPLSLPGHVSAAVKLWRTRGGEVLSYTSGAEDRILRWDGQQFVAISAALTGRTAAVEQMLETAEGDVWFGGVGLLVCWRRGDREWRLDQGAGLPYLVDEGRRTWFASNAGSHYLLAGREHAVPDLQEPLVLALGGVCGRSGSRVACWRDGRVVPLLIGQPDVVDTLALCAAPDGNLWVVGRDSRGELSLLRGDSTSWVTIAVLPREGSITGLTNAPGNGVYCVVRCGTACELVDATASTVTRERLPDLPLGMAPFCAFHGGGSRWLLGGHGLHRATAGIGWELVHELPGPTVSDAFENARGVWFLCRPTTGGLGGLAFLDASGWRFQSSSATLVAGMDSDGTRYLGGARGTMTVVPPDSRPYDLRLPVPARVRRVLRGTNGELWIGADVGLLRWQATEQRPRTLLRHAPQSVQVDDSIVLQVAALRRGWPQQLAGAFQVSHRIDAGDWSEFVPLGDGAVVLPPVPIGTHTVDVRVRDETGGIDASPPRVSVEVLAPRIETRWWFWMTGAGLLGALGVLSGLTLRARAARAVVQTEGRLRSVLENSPICILEIDAVGRLESINPAGRRMLGIGDRTQVIGREFIEFVAADDCPEVAGVLQRALGGEHTQIEFLSVGGRHLLAAMVPREAASGRSMRLTGLMQDVSEVRALAEQLSAAQRMEAIGLLAGGVAHDFNNLLTTMLGNVHLAREGFGRQMRSDGVDPLDEIELAGLHASELTRQLLGFARRLPAETVVQDPVAALRELEPLVRCRVKPGIELTVTVADDVPGVRLESGQFAQIVLNLAGNAVDAIHDSGQVHIGLTRAVVHAPTVGRYGRLPPGDYAKLTVRDTGCGMSPEAMVHAFEPFFTTKPRGKGTGLGLSMVHGIVQRAQGYVDVTSRLRHGSEFSVWLPAVAAPLEAARLPAPVAGPAGGGITILACDDDDSVLRMVQRVLTEHGYQVLVATDADAALRLAGDKAITLDLLLTDVLMPGIDGRGLATRMLDLRPGLPVLFMSGFEDTPTPGGVLRKPFVPAQLLSALRGLLHGQACPGSA